MSYKPIVEWFTRRDAIERAARSYTATAAEQTALTRGSDALRVADRLLDPADGTDRQVELAFAMFREAAYWLLAAAAPELAPDGSFNERRAAAAEATSSRASNWLRAHPAPEALGVSATAFAERSAKAKGADAESVQRWLHELADELALERGTLQRLRLERRLRLGLLLSPLLLVAGLGGRAWLNRSGPDLAAGKPWRASSTADTCQPAKGLCGGAYTKIFFHTQEEEKPWVEIDLLKPERFSRVEVQNRRDYGMEKAVPLLVQLSSDGQRYFQVAQCTEPFNEWTAHFEPQEARFVRVTVPRKTVLHLERVSVRP